MASPAKMSEQQRSLNTGKIRPAEDLIVGDGVLPFDVHDGAQASLMELFESPDLFAV